MADASVRGRIWRRMGLGAVALGALLAFPGSGISAEPGTTAVTFTRDVAPILQAKCEACHRKDSIAPMSLVTFEEARPWARAIKTQIVSRIMPPWHIDKTVGIQQFKNDRSLTDQEIDTIVRWVDGGAAKGDPKDLPPATGRRPSTSRSGRTTGLSRVGRTRANRRTSCRGASGASSP